MPERACRGFGQRWDSRVVQKKMPRTDGQSLNRQGGSMKRQLMLLGGGLLAAVGFHQLALSADGTTTDADSGALAEIVVTAEKRVETAQKTPISMEVYDAKALTEKGVVDMESLAATDTSLNFNNGGGEGYLTMRGVSSHDTTEIGSPSVPVVVDNFSSNRSWSLESSLFDLERIEVLRGPQGTLYGHSATGGLINVIPNRPGNSLEASASVEYGNYNTLNTIGVLNFPLNDILQLRLAASTRNHDGYHGVITGIDNTETVKADDEDSRALRAQLAFEPGEHLRGRVSFDYLHIGGVGAAVQEIPFNYVPGPSVSNPGSACNGSYLSSNCSGNDIYHSKPNLGSASNFPEYGQPSQDVIEKTGKWEFTYDGLPAGAKISYLGGYGDLEWHHLTEGSTSFFGDGGAANAFFPTRQYQQNEEPHTQNQELRVTSADGGVFTWQGGVYYFEEKSPLFSHLVLGPSAHTAADTYGPCYAGGSCDLLAFNFPYTIQTSEAVFGQGSVAITDNSKITAGARYNRDATERTGIFDLYFLGPIIGLPPGVFPTASEYGQVNSTKATWHLGYDLQATSANLFYAKVDTGYKPGGFNSCGNTLLTYDPEDVTTGELGTKNRFANDTVQWNAAAFYSDYKKQQVSQFINSCLQGTVTTNAGESRIYGFETDVVALIDPIGKIDASLSYLHARFVDFQTTPTIGAIAETGADGCGNQVPVYATSNGVKTRVGTNCQLSGNTLTQAPDLTLSIGLEHTWLVAGGDKLNYRIEGKFTTKQYFDAFNQADAEQGSYTVGNMYLDYRHDNWSVGLYCRNFTNTTYLTYAAEVTGGNSAEYDYGYGAPMTFGARFQVALKQ